MSRGLNTNILYLVLAMPGSCEESIFSSPQTGAEVVTQSCIRRFETSCEGFCVQLRVTKDDKKGISSHLGTTLAFSMKILRVSPQHLLHSQLFPNSRCQHNQCTCRFLQNQILSVEWGKYFLLYNTHAGRVNYKGYIEGPLLEQEIYFKTQV